MDILREQIIGYLQTLGYGFLEQANDFIAADKVDFGGARDTRLIWIPIEPEHDWDAPNIEKKLIHDFKDKTARYPNARGWVVAGTFGGFSQEFRAEAQRYGIFLRVPIQFFDTPFRYEEATQYQSAIKDLRTPPPRIPQPYCILVNGEAKEKGEDLLETLWNEFRYPDKPGLRVVVGPAGIGKTWLFRALFSRLYKQFLDQKNRLETFPRPIPLIPAYLKNAGAIRVQDLYRSFLEAEVASPIRLPTFEWLVVNGYATWLFDGLDELYAGDPDFFHNLVDLLTRQGDINRSHMLVCARESLLTSCEPFIEFINDYVDYAEDSLIRIYRLEGWESKSKRAFAKLYFDPPQDNRFVEYISRTESLKKLSELPYYCDLLGKAFSQGRLNDFIDDFTLLDYAVSEIVEREKSKGIIRPEDFQPNGLSEWLETIASEFFASGFKGVSRLEIETYAGLILASDLSDKERQDVITSLVQFPLFSPGIEPGVLAFQHELIAEYLAGRYWFERLSKEPLRAANELEKHPDLINSLIARYIAYRLTQSVSSAQKIIESLESNTPRGKAFTALLQLLLMSSPATDLLTPLRSALEGHNLSYIRFVDRNLDGFTFRNCDLSNTTFRRCSLKNSKFEGARIAGTCFEKLKKRDLESTQFGDLSHFENAFIDGERIDDRRVFAEWVREITGEITPILEPCPSAVQLRTLFLKFVHPDGSGRRDELPYKALVAGKQHPGAPNADEVASACIRFGYLQDTRWHERIRRVPGDRYNEMVNFVKDWQLTSDLVKLLSALCTKDRCEHVPLR